MNNEQALEDTIYFAKHFLHPDKGDNSLSAYNTPWIWIGGSYPGVRAAMIRQRNSDVFFASWSSSASLQTQIDGSVYYKNIIRSMDKNCSTDVHAAITFADEILSQGSEEEVLLLKQALFLTNNASRRAIFDMMTVSTVAKDLDEWECAIILATAFHAWPILSMAGPSSLTKFRARLETWNPSEAEEFTLSFPLSALANNSFDGEAAPDGIAVLQRNMVQRRHFLPS